MQTLWTEGSGERKRQIQGRRHTEDSAGTVPLSLPVTQDPCSPGWIGAAQVGLSWGGGLQDRFALGSATPGSKFSPSYGET